jgi:uncharacterized membrane protein YjgN (DUF898 family)
MTDDKQNPSATSSSSAVDPMLSDAPLSHISLDKPHPEAVIDLTPPQMQPTGPFSSPPPDPSASPFTPSASCPPPAQMPPALPETLGQVSRFQFIGNASDYFGIWFVNVLLTIITLSLYAPWAKVRRLRYFYTHTVLAKSRFEFTGQAKNIFLGRLLALAVYGLISSGNFVGESFKWVGGVGVIAIYLLMPWLLRSTYRFMSRNSVYRNTRFRFTGGVGEAFWVYLGLGFLTLLSLGFLLPYFLYRHKRYQFDHLQLGQVQFHYEATAGMFYRGLWFPMVMLGVMYVALIATVISIAVGASGMTAAALLVFVPIFLAVFVGMAFFFWAISAQLFRLSWNHVRVGNSPFRSDLRMGRYVWIAFSNYMVRAMTLGIFTPWAAVRMHKYRIESLSIFWQDDPEQLMTQAQVDPAAFGEELSDLFGFDLSL